jgi:hypothetical protein
MAYRLIGQDCLVATSLGGVVNGQPVSFNAAQSQKWLAKSIELDESAIDGDVTSLGDGLEKSRYKRSAATVRLKLQVSDSGPQFASCAGLAIRVDVQEVSSMVQHRVYVGMILRSNETIEDGETIETIEVKMGIEGWVYTGVYW